MWMSLLLPPVVCRIACWNCGRNVLPSGKVVVFLDAYPTIFSLLTICNGVAIFHRLVIWHVIRKELLHVQIN